MASPIGVEELATRLVNTFISVGTEVITLSLEEISRQTSSAIAIVIGKSGGDGRNRDAIEESSRSNTPPASLGRLQLGTEERVQQQVGKGGVSIECLLDATEEFGTDDAATSPHQRDSTEVQVPLKLGCSSAHQSESLCIGDQLGSIQGISYCGNEFTRIPLEGRMWASQHLLASILSSFNADKHRANTASPIKVTGTPISNATCAVHLPVPF